MDDTKEVSDNGSITMDDEGNDDTESNNSFNTATYGLSSQPETTECDNDEEDDDDYNNDTDFWYDFWYDVDDDDDDDDIDVDDVDLVELWGEESAIEFARNSYCVRLPASQRRLIEIFLREGHTIIGQYGPGASTNAPQDGSQNSGSQGDDNVGNLQRSHDSRGKRFLSESESSAKRKNIVKLAATDRQTCSDIGVQIRILNQRGDAGKVCYHLRTPVDLYTDITDTTTMKDLKQIVYETWETPLDKQHFFKSENGRELQSDTDEALLVDLGLKNGDTVSLRQATKDVPFQIDSPLLPDSIFWPLSRLRHAWLGQEYQYGMLSLSAKDVFDEDDVEDRNFCPYLGVNLEVLGRQSLQSLIKNKIIVNASLNFGSTNPVANNKNHRGFFVHSLSFSLKPSGDKYNISLVDDSTQSTSNVTTISRTLTNQGNHTAEGRLEVGLQGTSPCIGGGIGREFSHSTQTQDSAQIGWQQFRIRQGSFCRYVFERQHWSDNLLDYQIPYDGMRNIRESLALPEASCSNQESLRLKWDLDPLGDFMKLPSLWNWLCSDGKKKDREDKATMIIETRILLRKIHRIKVPQSKKRGKLPKAIWRKQEIDSYREVVVEQKVCLCNVPPTIFGVTSLCKLLFATVVLCTALLFVFKCVWIHLIPHICAMVPSWLEAAAYNEVLPAVLTFLLAG